MSVAVATTPASAQFFLKSKDLSDRPITAPEPGIGQPLPGATPQEWKAGLVWNLRAALNVAALQCQFEPTLLTVPNYNAMLTDHRDELKRSFDALTTYFNRVTTTKAAGQKALDQFATRTYSSFATVAAQYNFCETAALIGRAVIFAPRGTFGDVALERTRELQNSLSPWGEQAFPRFHRISIEMPRMIAECWDKNGEWVTKRCGNQFPPAPPQTLVSN